MNPLEFLRFSADFSSPSVVAAYDELPLWSAMFGVLLLEELPLAGVSTVLDVGCGTGFPAIELAERLGPQSDVHGVDPWSEALARAREKAACRQTSHVTFHEASAAAMPFGSATFDLIVSNLGVNNFDDRDSAIAECRRVARPEAMLALTTNLQGHMQEFYEVFDRVLLEAGDADGRRRLQRHVAHRATVDNTSDLLRRGGFAVRRVVERTGRMRFASGTALLNHHFIKLGFLDAWKKTVPGRETEIFLRLLERLDARAIELGGLNLTIPMAYIEAVATG